MVPRPLKTLKSLKIKDPGTPLEKADSARVQGKRERLSSEGYHPTREQEREFLFRTFHDMRNPLHAIMGYTSLVLRKTREQIPEKHQENLEKVIESAERLKEIVDRMVAFYREKK